jgi:hypothetical protein
MRARLDLQEGLLAEQSFSRLLVARIHFELLAAACEERCAVLQHAAHIEAVKVKPGAGGIFAGEGFGLGIGLHRMPRLPRRNRFGDRLECVRCCRARRPVLVEQIAQHALEEGVQLLRVLALDQAELTRRRSTRRLVAVVEQREQAVQARRSGGARHRRRCGATAFLALPLSLFSFYILWGMDIRFSEHFFEVTQWR